MIKKATNTFFAIALLANLTPALAADNDNFVSKPTKVVVKFIQLPFKIVGRQLGVGKSK
jgi:hypothetical protein